MIASGDRLVPKYDGQLLAHKPVFSFWTMIAGSSLFGMNEFGMRFFSAVSGLGCVLVVFAMGRSMYGQETGFLAGLILLSSLFYLAVCRSALMDAHFTFFISVALWGFWEGFRNPQRSLWWMLLCGAATGLAVFTKGPLGLLLIGAVGLFTLVGARQIRLVFQLHLVVAGLVFLAVAAPWYAAITLKTGLSFVRDFIVGENVYRALKPMQGHGGPVWYYLPVLLMAMLPWSLFIPWAVQSLWKGVGREKAFLLSWAVIPLVFFSLLGTKLPHYILPTFPVLALICARALVLSHEDRIRIPGYILPVVCGVGIILLISGVVGWVVSPALAGWRLTLCFFPLCLGWALAIRVRDKLLRVQLYLVGSSLAFILLAAHVMVPHLDQFRVVHQAATYSARWAEDKARQDQQPRLLAHRYREPGMLFYAQRRIPMVDDDTLGQALASPEPLLVIARKEYFELLPRDLQSRFSIQKSFEGFCENKGPMTLLLLEPVGQT
jgi:4-amino-4-deoxy-L-arabinose transferase-like glycosyltransferase